MGLIKQQPDVLEQAEETVAQQLLASLKEAAMTSPPDTLSSSLKRPSDQKMDRGYVDGCYDLCHSGHFNAIRQASKVVHTLVVGPNSDAEIMAQKGPTVLSGAERAEILRAVKWGDVVIPDTPYDVTTPLLDELNCQFYIHGDDPVMIDGRNICEDLNAIGRFKEVRRTTGISTTDITGKLLKLVERGDNPEAEGARPGAPIADPPRQTFL